MLREELQLLQEPGSYVGEVIKVMGKNKVLVKVHPEGKFVVDLDKDIDVAKARTGRLTNTHTHNHRAPPRSSRVLEWP